MVIAGQLERVKRGLYRLTEIDPVSHDSFLDIQFAIPQGVICLLSALDYYELSTINPIKIHLAVPRKTTVYPPDYPPVEVHYITEWYYQLGINDIFIRNEKVKIYSPEKTLCDCIRYKNKIGNDITIESFKNYLGDKKKRNLALLLEMAQACRVKDTVTNYAEVLI
jgi:predicted transcriptional regulator of viral defense system